MSDSLVARQYYGDNCYSDYYGNVNCTSGWYRWGRWVLLGVIIVVVLVLFFLCSCLSARRRRRMGYNPYRGTGWTLGRTPPGHAPATYNAQPYYANNQPQQEQPMYNNSNNPPPAYGANSDYYGNSNNVELQQPSATYGGYGQTGQSAYEPPKGPPPRS